MIKSLQLGQRFVTGELMDQPGLDPHRHQQALRGLTRINRFSLAGSVIWRPIERQAKRLGRPLKILDVATGAGDLPIWLKRRSCRANVPAQISACDMSPTAIAYARQQASRRSTEVNFFQLDVLRDEIPTNFDVILCSFFLHHLENDSVVDFLSRLRHGDAHLVIISDLRRCFSGYVLAWLGTRLLSRSPIVHVDGPLSVRAAFSLTEIRELARGAGLNGVRIQRKWPFRYLMTWERP